MLTCMDANPNVNVVRIHVDKVRLMMPHGGIAAANREDLYDDHVVETDFDHRTQEYVLTQRMTGQKMLETLEKIFAELDEMGVPMESTVSCPHGHGAKHDIMYMGRRLQFCDDCHSEVAMELERMNRNLRPAIWDGSVKPIVRLEGVGCR